MIYRSLFTPNHDDPPYPVIISETCTVPTEPMAYLLATLLATDGDVLELGTGSGYQTAVLAEQCRSVTSIEFDRQLILEAAAKLPPNVVLIEGNALTYDTETTFDGILATFTLARIPRMWVVQLKEGGRLVVPLQAGFCSKICVYEKRGEELHLVDIPAYANFTGAVEG